MTSEVIYGVFQTFKLSTYSKRNQITRGFERDVPHFYVKRRPCRVGSVGSVSASRTVGREFASRPGHTKDHHKNGTNCLPA